MATAGKGSGLWSTDSDIEKDGVTRSGGPALSRAMRRKGVKTSKHGAEGSIYADHSPLLSGHLSSPGLDRTSRF